MNFEDMLNQVVKVRVTVSNVDDDEWETGRLADFDDKRIKLVLRSGSVAYILIDDIRFIATCRKQPDDMV